MILSLFDNISAVSFVRLNIYYLNEYLLFIIHSYLKNFFLLTKA